MKLHPRVNRIGVELVKRFEGLRRRAARLPDGGWTIGYGHTLTAREGAEVSPEDAEALLYYDLSEVAGKVEAWVFTPLNQNQFEALTAFAFNIGVENFRHSTVLKRVNEGQHLLGAAAMELWRKADFNGEEVVVDALVRRRAAEKAHYLTPPEGFKPSPSQVLRPTFDHSVIEAAAQAQTSRRAAVVDVPLEGDATSAIVEAGPDDQKPTHHLSPLAARDLAALAPTSSLASAPAEIAPLVLESEDHPADPEPTVADAAMNDRNGFDAPPFPATTIPAPSGFRGFEPPPRRFGQEASATLPQAANEAYEPVFLAPAPASTAPAHEPVAEPMPESSPEVGEAASDLTLFNQPLAPPSPTPVLAESVRTMRLAADEAESMHGSEPQPDPVAERNRPAVVNGVEKHGLLQNRFFLYASIGVLGIFLFSVAVGNMALGSAASATPGTLFMGLLGIVLMTPAGVWFLMQRLNGPQVQAHH